MKFFSIVMFLLIPTVLFGVDDPYDTISIKPMGVNYSKYQGTDKLYIVGECDGLVGNQIVVFQNRPSFEYFENNETFNEEQKELENAIWSEILDNDAEPIIVKGRWHQYNDRMVFLCHQILQLNKNNPKVP